MQIAAALLAGGVTFFAGFCLGLYPPSKRKPERNRPTPTAGQNRFLEKFLNYDGEVMP